MIISPSAISPYKIPTFQSGGASFVGLLDLYPNAAAAYSVRLLKSDYAGSAMEVRRSSDNALQDIGFDANGDLDTASLLSFVGAGDGFVRTWYDQSGNANNAQNITSSLQPQIVNSGAYLGYLQTLNVSGNMVSSYAYVNGNAYSSFSYFENNGRCVIGGTNTGSAYYGSGQSGSALNSAVGFSIQSYYKNGASIGTTQNDMFTATLSFSQFSLLITSINTKNLAIGYTGPAFNNNRFKEFILYPNQTVSRIDVENNQIDYYGV